MNIYLKVILRAAIGFVVLYVLASWYLWWKNVRVSYASSVNHVPVVKTTPRVIERAYISVQAEQPQTKQAQNLTGVWKCNDGGLYFIRQVGNQVWWYGESGDGGVAWSNVFQGYVTGNKIIGKWADVPKGTARNYGEMTLLISSNSLRKISGGQNFTGSVWSH